MISTIRNAVDLPLLSVHDWQPVRLQGEQSNRSGNDETSSVPADLVCAASELRRARRRSGGNRVRRGRRGAGRWRSVRSGANDGRAWDVAVGGLRGTPGVFTTGRDPGGHRSGGCLAAPASPAASAGRNAGVGHRGAIGDLGGCPGVGTGLLGRRTDQDGTAREGGGGRVHGGAG